MRIEIIPYYTPITEKPYCCVPAVLQMIQQRRGFDFASQDEIGYQLGLIVPPEMQSLFTKLHTGHEPKAGWGTQTAKEEFSIDKYFQRNGLPFRLRIQGVENLEELRNILAESIYRGDDIIICYNSKLLFGDGDIEHVSLIQDLDTSTGDIMVVDPARGAPKHRKSNVKNLFEVLKSHYVSDRGRLWIVSALDNIR